MTGCLFLNENKEAKTITELMEGEWTLVARSSGDDTISDRPGPPADVTYAAPDFPTTIGFEFVEFTVMGELGPQTASARIHFLEGGITGTTEGPNPDYWDDWSLAWISYEDTLRALNDDMGFPRTIIVHEVSKDSMLLEYEYFWNEYWLKYARN